MEESERERLEAMLEAITLAGERRSGARGGCRSCAQLAAQAKAVEDAGAEAKLSRPEGAAPDGGLLRPPRPAPAALHRVQGHAGLPGRAAQVLGLPRRLHPRRNEVRLARRAGHAPLRRAAVPGRRRSRSWSPPRRPARASTFSLQHPLQLRHPVEPQPPGAADGPHPSLRPAQGLPDLQLRRDQHDRGARPAAAA